jgi:hypothetical protein
MKSLSSWQRYEHDDYQTHFFFVHPSSSNFPVFISFFLCSQIYWKQTHSIRKAQRKRKYWCFLLKLFYNVLFLFLFCRNKNKSKLKFLYKGMNIMIIKLTFFHLFSSFIFSLYHFFHFLLYCYLKFLNFKRICFFLFAKKFKAQHNNDLCKS